MRRNRELRIGFIGIVFRLTFGHQTPVGDTEHLSGRNTDKLPLVVEVDLDQDDGHAGDIGAHGNQPIGDSGATAAPTNSERGFHTPRFGHSGSKQTRLPVVNERLVMFPLGGGCKRHSWRIEKDYFSHFCPLG